VALATSAAHRQMNGLPEFETIWGANGGEFLTWSDPPVEIT
jgi:hypothetical protein